MSNVKIPAIPEPTMDVRSLHATVLALKEAVETLSGQRGTPVVVTWDDLIRLDHASPNDIPK